VPYFDNKQIVKTFIIVTDEEENTNAKTKDGKSWNFFDLFMEYRRVVFPASLVFVSFLSDGQRDLGQMYKKFLDKKVPDVEQFKFCGVRPDLSRLDTILGKLCSKSMNEFNASVEEEEGRLGIERINVNENLVTHENKCEEERQSCVSFETIKINMY